ncbi:MAG: zinc ribbon domain-containing protein, partial [Candidatus Bathyarchaeia archaeon]
IRGPIILTVEQSGWEWVPVTAKRHVACKKAEPPNPAINTVTQAASELQSSQSEALASLAPSKFCRSCGAKIPRDSKFCNNCGTKQP